MIHWTFHKQFHCCVNSQVHLQAAGASVSISCVRVCEGCICVRVRVCKIFLPLLTHVEFVFIFDM